jgi:uncharacterized membrane protein
VKALSNHLRAHPHLAVSGLAGVVVAAAASGLDSLVGRCLLGWNVGVWMYLVWTAWTMTRSSPERLKRVAKAQAEGARTVLIVVALAALASLGAVVLQLSAAKAAGPGHALRPVLFTLSTVIGSWLLVPTLFSLNYASQYHVADVDGGGLRFPDESAHFEPDYSDFLYFSFTIAVATQTADVLITNRSVRRLVLLQSVLSFVFNTTVLAFMINMAASLF